METEPTPTPWQVDERSGCIAIYEATRDYNCLDIPKYHFIAYFSGYRDDLNQWQVRDKDSANAAFIVRAVNAHDDLIVALDAASHALRSYQYGNASPELAAEIANKCDAVLEKARG